MADSIDLFINEIYFMLVIKLTAGQKVITLKEYDQRWNVSCRGRLTYAIPDGNEKLDIPEFRHNCSSQKQKVAERGTLTHNQVVIF